jgi:CheY-like chemotaxis protein
MLTSEQFLKHLRDALNHLYDPDRLRRSPLAALFGVAGRFDTPSFLQRILTEAIESLKPKPDELPRSHSRRIYDLLLYRYVQQFSQQEVSNQLGMSVRHLRREQRAALEALAYHLWEQFQLEDKVHADVGRAPVRASEVPEMEVSTQATAPGPATSPSVNEELAWLKEAPPEISADLAQTLPAVLDLARPLAVQHRVHLETALADGLPNLAVHPIALRQTILNVLSVAIHRASGGQITISARPVRWEVGLQVRCTSIPPGPKPTLENADIADVGRASEATSLDMAIRLANLCGGRLALSLEERAFEATLTLPALEQLPVLVIDDNADTLQLLQRYTAGTRYRLIGTQDPEQALDLAEKFSPQIIVLDVMMPQVDGWEVLGWLRQHPVTEHTPIVVCTILAQEELAFSLGASAFLRKPITRQGFLSALTQQIAQTAQEPR